MRQVEPEVTGAFIGLAIAAVVMAITFFLTA
jgi:hypothetical protein